MTRRMIPLTLAALMAASLAGAVPASAQEAFAPFLTIDAAPDGADVASGDRMDGTEMTNTRPLADGAVGSLPLFVADDEYGCVWASAQASGGEWIGVARRGEAGPEGLGPCAAFQAKVSAAEAAGAAALIVVNHEPGHTAGLAAGGIPAIMIDQAKGDALIASIDGAEAGAVQGTVELLDPETFVKFGTVFPTEVRSVEVTRPDANTLAVSGRAAYGGVGLTSIGDDPEGDAMVPLPAQSGNDLVEAFVGQPDPFEPDLKFVFELSDLPETGGLPEVMRYFWDFGVNIDGEVTPLQINGKLTNLSGSAFAQNPDARAPAFDLRGNCTQDGNIISCEKVANLDAAMNPNTNRITVTVPMDVLGKQVEGDIGGASVESIDIFQGIAVLPSAVFSASGTGDQLFPLVDPYFTIGFHSVEVGIVPAGADAAYQTQVRAHQFLGTFDATLDVSGLEPGDYDVHVRACFASNCDTAVTTVTL